MRPSIFRKAAERFILDGAYSGACYALDAVGASEKEAEHFNSLFKGRRTDTSYWFGKVNLGYFTEPFRAGDVNANKRILALLLAGEVLR